MAPPRVTFLGTGGALNLRRYQAAMLVEWRDLRILLDTGGGTELVRRLQGAGVSPSSITDVFLSHRHPDHSGGLEPLLLYVGIRAMTSGQTPPSVRIHTSARTRDAFLTAMDALDSHAPRRFGDRLAWVCPPFGTPSRIGEDATLALVHADHLPPEGGAAGCVLDLGATRIAYSGDTRPTWELPAAAVGADLLVHEVGGLHEHLDVFVRPPHHSTTREVAAVALQARARRLALFHLPPEEFVSAEALLAEVRTAAPGLDVFIPDDGEVVDVA